MTILITPIEDDLEKKLRKVLTKEWSDSPKFQEEIRHYVADAKYLTESVVMTHKNKVIGGVYMTNHPDELSVHTTPLPFLIGHELIVFDEFVITPAYRGKGLSKIFLEFIKKEYISHKGFEGIVFSTPVIETLYPYQKIGAVPLYNGCAGGTYFDPIYGKEILKEHCTFAFLNSNSTLNRLAVPLVAPEKKAICKNRLNETVLLQYNPLTSL